MIFRALSRCSKVSVNHKFIVAVSPTNRALCTLYAPYTLSSTNNKSTILWDGNIISYITLHTRICGNFENIMRTATFVPTNQRNRHLHQERTPDRTTLFQSYTPIRPLILYVGCLKGFEPQACDRMLFYALRDYVKLFENIMFCWR